MSIRKGNSIISGTDTGDGKSITRNSSSQLQTIGVIDQSDNNTALKYWTGTRAEYEALAVKDPNTFYNVTDDFDARYNKGFLGQIIQSPIPLTDASLHLLDGALISGSGSYSAFVDYIAELYDTISVSGYKANIVKVGSLTEVDGVLSGFSASNYAKTNITLNFGSADTWEIVTKQNISSVSSINDGYMGVLGGAYNVNYYISASNKITVELSSNGTSYNIGSIGMLSAITLNTDFYLKTEFTGTAYNLYYSTDGETWTLQGSISSSTKVSSRTNNFAFGVDEAGSHASWVGSVDLKGCYINTNGVCLWTGVEETKPIFCTEAQWQTSVTTYGVCGKFVYDSVNNTVRLPKVTGFVEGASGVTNLGDLTEAGLPNITGYTNVDTNTGSTYVGGAFYTQTTTGCYTAAGSVGVNRLRFDASLSNTIYGNSSTVQPQSVKVLYYIVIATITKTNIQVDIDHIATDLNSKADVDLTNCTDVANIKMAHNAMPSDTYIDLTLGASGASYTAPADGWVGAFFQNSYTCNLHNLTCTGINSVDFLPSAETDRYATIQVSKGNVFSLYYTGTLQYFRFIYAKGSESEAN